MARSPHRRKAAVRKRGAESTLDGGRNLGGWRTVQTLRHGHLREAAAASVGRALVRAERRSRHGRHAGIRHWRLRLWPEQCAETAQKGRMGRTDSSLRSK
eukprot:6206599-Pleurochrysis_carterae.AAC.4